MGSEMCIRDRANDIREEMRELSVRAPGKTPLGQLGPRTIAQWLTRSGETVFEGWSLQRTKVTVSYTHLTLPTILLV